jgi:YVTN family beta-propeller protein
MAIFFATVRLGAFVFIATSTAAFHCCESGLRPMPEGCKAEIEKHMKLTNQQVVTQLNKRTGVRTITRGKLRWLAYLAQILAVLFVLTCLGLAYLIYPATPSRSDVMRFDGFVTLPRGGMLNVLDYLTWYGHALLVAGGSTGSVFKIPDEALQQGADESATQLRGRPSVHGIAFAQEADIGFVTRSRANVVDVLNLKEDRILRSIPVADDPDAILYDQDYKLIYVANGDANLVTLIDPDRRTTVAAISLGGKPENAAIDSFDGLVYQNIEDINAVAAVDLKKRAIVGQWPLASCDGPSGLAIDSKHRRLFAGCSGNSSLAVFDLERHKVITVLKTGSHPDSVAFDSGLQRIYTAAVGGTLTVIHEDSAETYRVLDNVRTHFGAHTLIVDPASHRVYVAYSSLVTCPRVAVFTPLTRAVH